MPMYPAELAFAALAVAATTTVNPQAPMVPDENRPASLSVAQALPGVWVHDHALAVTLLGDDYPTGRADVAFVLQLNAQRNADAFFAAQSDRFAEEGLALQATGAGYAVEGPEDVESFVFGVALHAESGRTLLLIGESGFPDQGYETLRVSLLADTTPAGDRVVLRNGRANAFTLRRADADTAQRLVAQVQAEAGSNA